MWKPKISLNFQKKNSSLGLYMVPEDMYVSVSQWSSGICPGVKINWWRCRSQKPQQVGRTKRSNHRNPTNRFNSRTHCFLHFCQLSWGEKWFSLHKQSLPEEDECTQASTDSVSAKQIGEFTETLQISRTNGPNSETRQIGRTNRQSWPNSAADVGGPQTHSTT